MNNLKPCPFCGNTQIKTDPCSVHIRCGKCFASDPIFSKYLVPEITEREAAAIAWNHRASPKEVPE